MLVFDVRFEAVTMSVAAQALLYGVGRCVVRTIIPVFRVVEVQIDGSKRRGGLRIVVEGRRTRSLSTRASTALYILLPKRRQNSKR